MAGAVVAGKEAGGYDNFANATRAMTHLQPESFEPVRENAEVYARLYELYRMLHDGFGISGREVNMYQVMKELLRIRDEVRAQ